MKILTLDETNNLVFVRGNLTFTTKSAAVVQRVKNRYCSFRTSGSLTLQMAPLGINKF